MSKSLINAKVIKKELFNNESDIDSSGSEDDNISSNSNAVDIDRSVEQNIVKHKVTTMKTENITDNVISHIPDYIEATNDIFGESDEEDFEGFNENEIEKETPVIEKEFLPRIHKIVNRTKQSRPVEEESFDEEPNNVMKVFESILEKQKAETRLNRPRKRDNIEYLNDMDDKISELINKMKLAAIEDEEMFHHGHPGFKKMLLLPEVRNMLKLSNIKPVLIELNFLNIMATWLKPISKHILPPLDIRVLILNSLIEFPVLTRDSLKESNIGKAVMYLLKHPRETSDNKTIAANLINKWFRPIFNLSSDYNEMTREDRIERDRSIVTKRKLVDNDASAMNGDDTGNNQSSQSRQSNKDYIIRPNWRVGNKKQRVANSDNDSDDQEDDQRVSDEQEHKRVKISENPNNKHLGLERTFRKVMDAGKKRKMIQRASNISIQGKGLDI